MVGKAAGWPDELIAVLAGAGFVILAVDDVAEVPFFVLAGGVTAVLLHARGLGIRDLLALRAARAHSPATAVVVIAANMTTPDLNRAIESGATSFLSWPAPPDVLLRTLRGS